MDPDAAEAMLNAYEQGGDKAFMTWATNFYDQEYLEDWGFQTVDSIEIESPYGGGWR
jgi:N-acetylglutamate synthase-like GNAT family acetyltransferase